MAFPRSHGWSGQDGDSNSHPGETTERTVSHLLLVVVEQGLALFSFHKKWPLSALRVTRLTVIIILLCKENFQC